MWLTLPKTMLMMAEYSQSQVSTEIDAELQTLKEITSTTNRQHKYVCGKNICVYKFKPFFIAMLQLFRIIIFFGKCQAFLIRVCSVKMESNGFATPSVYFKFHFMLHIAVLLLFKCCICRQTSGGLVVRLAVQMNQVCLV